MGGRRKKKFHLKRPKGEKSSNPTAAGSSSSTPPPWIELPRDVTAYILHRLGTVEILENVQKVCTTWRSVCREPSIWRVIDMKLSDGGLKIFGDADIMCRRAVDRSQGELIDINIKDFGTDDLLRYISDRSCHLKRLKLVCCHYISGSGLTTAVKKFPELEELHLFFMPLIHAGDIETISMSCPMLKSLTFNIRGYMFPEVDIDDSYALTVAKSMPNVRHLRLFGNKLSDEGLRAILVGCPHLELLDLRQCFNVYLRGDLGKRCFRQIKEVRTPTASTADYEWDDYAEEDDDIYSPGDYGDLEDYEDYEYYENYDDYTNPFNDLPYPANLVWYMDQDGYL
ncbi:hypothetical protein OROGR_000937 [Orobanche gracilis]